MNVAEREEAYQHLKAQLMRGELDEGDFKRGVDKLSLTDSQGKHWKMGWYTGKWYYEVDGQWIQGTPDEDGAQSIVPGATGAGEETKYARRIERITRRGDEKSRRLSSTTCLVLSLVAVLAVSVFLLILGAQWGWWQQEPDSSTVVAEPAATEGVETTATSVATDEPLPTKTPQATKTATSRPTATNTRPVPTATARPTETVTQPSASPTPSPTATSTETPAATATRSARATAAPSLSGRLYVPVFDSNPDRLTYDIHTIQLGSGQREITVGQASQPDLSPDGKRLVYRSWEPDQRGIFVRELADGKTWRIVPFHEAEHPSWGPDSQYIVFSSRQESDRKWRLYRTWGLESGMVRRDGGDIFGRVPTWAADGRILYWECPLGACGLYTIHPDGTNTVRITQSDKDTAPAASPGMESIVFMSNISGNWELYLTSATPVGGQPDSDPEQITRNGARDGLPTWSPDGRWLAFVSDRSGAWAVWAMRPNGSGLQRLFDLDGQLEGEVANVPTEEQHGWTWEQLAWGP